MYPTHTFVPPKGVCGQIYMRKTTAPNSSPEPLSKQHWTPVRAVEHHTLGDELSDEGLVNGQEVGTGQVLPILRPAVAITHF